MTKVKCKKTILILIIVILVVVLLIEIFLIKNNFNYPLVEEGSGGLIGYLKDGTLTSTGVTLVIEDKDDLVDSFCKCYTIEKFEDDTYIEVTKINDFYSCTELYYTAEDGIIELDLDWTEIYGKLSRGEYLLIYDTGDYRFEFSFSID